MPRIDSTTSTLNTNYCLTACAPVSTQSSASLLAAAFEALLASSDMQGEAEYPCEKNESALEDTLADAACEILQQLHPLPTSLQDDPKSMRISLYGEDVLISEGQDRITLSDSTETTWSISGESFCTLLQRLSWKVSLSPECYPREVVETAETIIVMMNLRNSRRGSFDRCVELDAVDDVTEIEENLSGRQNSSLPSFLSNISKVVCSLDNANTESLRWTGTAQWVRAEELASAGRKCAEIPDFEHWKKLLGDIESLQSQYQASPLEKLASIIGDLPLEQRMPAFLALSNASRRLELPQQRDFFSVLCHIVQDFLSAATQPSAFASLVETLRYGERADRDANAVTELIDILFMLPKAYRPTAFHTVLGMANKLSGRDRPAALAKLADQLCFFDSNSLDAAFDALFGAAIALDEHDRHAYALTAIGRTAYLLKEARRLVAFNNMFRVMTKLNGTQRCAALESLASLIGNLPLNNRQVAFNATYLEATALEMKGLNSVLVSLASVTCYLPARNRQPAFEALLRSARALEKCEQGEVLKQLAIIILFLHESVRHEAFSMIFHSIRKIDQDDWLSPLAKLVHLISFLEFRRRDENFDNILKMIVLLGAEEQKILLPLLREQIGSLSSAKRQAALDAWHHANGRTLLSS